jgi:hypothetical protein
MLLTMADLPLPHPETQRPIVLIAGGTGLIGSRLSVLLEDAGYAVRHLSRKAQADARFPAFAWNPDSGYIDEHALDGVLAVINLAGAGIADKPWTQGRKEIIISSRVRSALLLRDAMSRRSTRPLVYLSGGAIGFYGNRGDEWLYEDSEPGQGFLSESCIAWEKAAHEVESTGIRTVIFRIGLVLSTAGGALPKLLLPLHFGLSPYFANGKQWYSWIHIDDLCKMFLFALKAPNLSGTFNAVGPQPVTNAAFAKILPAASGKKALVCPAPALALRIGMGEMADTVLFSARVSSQKIEKESFACDFPELAPAIADLIRGK